MIRERRAFLFAIILGGLAFLAYRMTAAPGLLPGDAGEFQFTLPTLGLSHPTGYPLYHLLGWLWERLFLVNPAQGANQFSALWGGVAVGLFYLLAYEALSQLLSHLRWRSGATWLAALTTAVFAGNTVFWAQATQAEVYTLLAAFIAAVLVAVLVRGRNTGDDLRPAGGVWLPALILGLGLTHHLMLVLLLPGLFAYLLLARPDLLDPGRLLRLAPFTLIPLLLYAYVPLRAPASPWLSVQLNPGHTLPLFDHSVSGVLRFILGVGFAPALRGVNAAIGQIPFAFELFLNQFTWLGLILILIGLAALVLEEQVPTLLLTLVSFLALVVFDLFYGIGDIQAYYIAPMLIATVWMGLGLAYLIDMVTRITSTRLRPFLFVPAAALLIIPALHFQAARPLFDRSASYETGYRWSQIARLNLPTNAILVSNDRDEMTPMIYEQVVEGQMVGMTALFPQISAGAAWADLNDTLASALATGRPVYTVKPMPGIEIRYQVEPVAGDIWRVVAAHPAPVPSFEYPYGEDLRWLNLEWTGDTRPGGALEVTLVWRVVHRPDIAWHSFLQLLDNAGNKVAQADDHQLGDDYLPAPLWRPGDVIADQFILPLPADLPPGSYTLVAGFYDPATGARIADPLVVATVQSP